MPPKDPIRDRNAVSYDMPAATPGQRRPSAQRSHRPAGRIVLVALLMSSACMALASQAQAQSDNNSQRARPEVRELVVQSSAHFQHGDYEAALQALLSAYKQQPLPLLLFNIAQTYRKAGRSQAALEWYQRFVTELPQSPLAPEAEAHSAALRAELAAQKAAQDRADAERLSAEARARLQEAEAVAAANEVERQRAQAAMLERQNQKPATPVWRRGWFWGVVGGTVAVGAAVAIGVSLAMQPPPEPMADLPEQTIRF